MAEVTTIQLPLFDETAFEVACPHCGTRFNALGAMETEQRVFEHPRIASLPDSTRDFLRAAPREFLLGGQVGVTRLHRATDYSLGGVSYQLGLLRERGVVKAIPKRPGGKNCQYRLVLNGA